MRTKTTSKPHLLYLAVMAASAALVLLTTGISWASHRGAVAPAAHQACVPGPHSGALADSQTWCLADSPHGLSDNVVVPAGVTLTVEAGVTVQGNRYKALLVEGHLDALGTAAQPITFTSFADSGSGQWAGLGVDGGSADLRHTTVRYAGDGNDVSTSIFNLGYYRAALTVREGRVTLETVTLQAAAGDGYDHGLLIGDSQVTIADTMFTGIGNGGGHDVAMRVAGPTPHCR